MSKEVKLNEVAKELDKKIDLIGASLISQIAFGIEKRARSNFNRARKVTGSDEDRTLVTVTHLTTTTSSGFKTTITCSGDQVLFMEFGAGTYNVYSRKVEGMDVSYSDKFSNSTWVFDDARGEMEILQFGMPSRPTGIVPLGHYGKGRGMDGLWVRPSDTGIPNLSAGESHVLNKRGEERPNVVWTYGTPPTRSLYRAVVTTLSNGGK